MVQQTDKRESRYKMIVNNENSIVMVHSILSVIQ